MSGTCDRRELPLIRTHTGFLFAFDTSEMSAMSHVQSEVQPEPPLVEIAFEFEDC